MRRYWKIGSRWSEDGKDNSVLPIFKANEVVFLADNEKDTEWVKRFRENSCYGEIIAVSDGKKIVAVCRLRENPQPLNRMLIEIPHDFKGDFDLEEMHDHAFGAFVDWHDIKLSDQIEYAARGTIHGIGDNDILSQLTKITNALGW